MADERSDLPGYGPGEPRESWATPKQASTFFGTWVHKFEKDGGIHNQQRVPNETWEQLVSEARETLGWQGVKIDLYTLDHSVREVDKTFTQLGWHFDQNRPNPSELDEPATVATAHEAMRLLERYYSSYEPNELPKGTSLLEVYSLEIQLCTATKNTVHMKKIYPRTLNLNAAVADPRIMGVIREEGGKM